MKQVFTVKLTREQMNFLTKFLHRASEVEQEEESDNVIISDLHDFFDSTLKNDDIVKTKPKKPWAGFGDNRTEDQIIRDTQMHRDILKQAFIDTIEELRQKS